MSQSQAKYRVLLFYKYVKIADSAQFTVKHRQFCKYLGIKGRIIIAGEGINGTLAGTQKQTQRYIEHLRADSRFEDIEFKKESTSVIPFPRLTVKHKQEIVQLELPKDLDPSERTGVHLSPEKYYQAMQQDDVVLVDVRNNYEYELGHFKGAVRPNVKSFREFPQWAKEQLQDAKNKKILTYCTGGVRCEKFTAFLLEEGFSEVYQLQGGIINYAQDPTVKGKLFEGKCYVFDNRKAVSVNQEQERIVSQCSYCQQPCDRYIDCHHPSCSCQFFCCLECEQQHQGACQHCITHF